MDRIRAKKRLDAKRQLAHEENQKRIKDANVYYSKLGSQSASRRIQEYSQKEKKKRDKEVAQIIEQQRRSVQAVNVMRLILPHYQPEYSFKSLVSILLTVQPFRVLVYRLTRYSGNARDGETNRENL